MRAMLPLYSASTARSRPRIRIAPPVVLFTTLVATLLIYWPGTHGGFLLDDYPNIVANTALHIHNLKPSTLVAAAFSSRSGLLDRPLSMLTFAINDYFTGLNPYWMKLTNIVIHCINGLLVYLVTTLILKAYRRRYDVPLDDVRLDWMAVAVAAAWLLLPINLTAVLYVVQRMTSLSGTFVLAGLALYLRGRLNMLAGRSGLWLLWTGIVALGALAVLTKEVGALLPVYAVATEWILFDFRTAAGRRDRRVYLLFAVTLVLPAILGLALVAPSQFTTQAYANRTFTLGQRLLTEPRVVMDYVGWILIPRLDALSLYHDDYPISHGLLSPPTTLLSLLGIALLLVAALWQRRRWPLVSLGILWFLGGQLLTATIFNLELVYEHRNYLPSLGLLLAVFPMLLVSLSGRRAQLLGRTLVVGLIGLYAVLTMLRVQEWSNPPEHLAIAAAEHPDSPRATYALGRLYATLVDKPDSRFLPLAIKALEQAAKVPGADILPEQALLFTSARQHLPLKAAWWNSMDHKLASKPISAQGVGALYAMVDCELRKECVFPVGRMKQVLAITRKTNPRNADVLTIAGNYTLNVLHKPYEARELMARTTRLAPREPQYWINIIKLDIALHRFNDVHQELRTLSGLNRFGQLDKSLKALRLRLHHAERAHPATAPSPTARTIPQTAAGSRRRAR